MRVAIRSDSARAIAAAFTHCLAAGDELVVLHPHYSDAELAACLADAQPDRMLDGVPQGAPLDLHGPDRPALRLYTSGTTGPAHGVTLSTGALRRTAEAGGERLGLRPEDRWFCPLPLHHVGGLMVLVRCALFGATPLLEPLSRGLASATLVSLVPTQLARLVSAGTRPPAGLRAALLGGGPLSVELQQAARALGWPVVASYGMTETAGMCCCALPGDAHPGHCGTPLQGWSLRIEEDEIVVRGPTTRGWIFTGDAGRLDAAGNLQLLSRRTDRITSGGENVRADEVEAALLRHPAVAEACAVGLDDPEWGQRVVAAVVLRNVSAADAEILAEAARTLARHELPRELLRVDALPRTELDKLQRARVRELF